MPKRHALVIVIILLATVAALRLEGRRWWCACTGLQPWKSDVWSSHCSQHLADPYSFTHFGHGLFFCGLFSLLVPKWTRWTRFTLTIGAAAAWEIAENSAFVIERYRSATMSLSYLGDSIINALGDIGACALGFCVAMRLGWKWSIALFVCIEIVLLFLIRDNLTLNVIMLIYPMQAIKQWQMAGHLPA